eukprot:4502108-Amphidinium_carterae.1
MQLDADHECEPKGGIEIISNATSLNLSGSVQTNKVQCLRNKKRQAQNKQRMLDDQLRGAKLHHKMRARAEKEFLHKRRSI